MLRIARATLAQARLGMDDTLIRIRAVEPTTTCGEQWRATIVHLQKVKRGWRERDGSADQDKMREPLPSDDQNEAFGIWANMLSSLCTITTIISRHLFTSFSFSRFRILSNLRCWVCCCLLAFPSTIRAASGWRLIGAMYRCGFFLLFPRGLCRGMGCDTMMRPSVLGLMWKEWENVVPE